MKPACSLQVNLIIILTHGYQGLAAPGALARRASAFGWARHRLFPDSDCATPGLGWSCEGSGERLTEAYLLCRKMLRGG